MVNRNHAAPQESNRPLIAITGPTGSGKSILALCAARQFDGEIVNCDSLQLYRGFDVGTAKLPPSARLGIPHHLFDVLEPQQSFSAGEYARRAREAIEGISSRGRLPVIAGGTGFYLRALLCGLPQLPERDDTLRARLDARERRRPGSLHRLLQRLDPAAGARIHPHDARKLIRALEVRMLTRHPLPPPAAAEPLRGYRILRIGLDPARADLHEVLNARAREMFRCGLIEEVERWLARGCTGLEKPFESLGYKQALQCVRSSLSLEEAIASTQLETRQYAKRQLTWFRRDPGVKWLYGFGHEARIAQQCFEWLHNFI
jgi:tRNA dimethylallyltransferase